MAKTVTVLVRTTPLRSHRAAEALRMAVGQTLADHRVQLILSGPAVYILGEVRPEQIGGVQVQRSLDTLRMLGHPILVEQESLQASGLLQPPEGVEVRSRSEVAALLANSEVIYIW